MRRGPVDSGWAGSLFDDPINQVKAILTPLQFPETGPFPDDHGELVRYGHETWHKFELNGKLVEEFVSTDRPVSKESEFAAEMVAVDAARKAAGDLPLARCFVKKGLRVYEDPELQERHRECTHKLASQGNGGICAGCSERKGEPCKYSRVMGVEPAPAIEPAKKPAKAKKQAKPEPAPVPQTCSDCLCLTCTNKAMCHQCKSPAICAKYNARTITCPGFSDADHSDGWICSDCLCPKCANSKENCRDCKGPVYCSKHGGKIGNCPDFRTEEGKEQHCLENGCLCFKCQLIGDNCEECPGPIRCDGPRMKCKEYVGAEVEA